MSLAICETIPEHIIVVVCVDTAIAPIASYADPNKVLDPDSAKHLNMGLPLLESILIYTGVSERGIRPWVLRDWLYKT